MPNAGISGSSTAASALHASDRRRSASTFANVGSGSRLSARIELTSVLPDRCAADAASQRECIRDVRCVGRVYRARNAVDLWVAGASPRPVSHRYAGATPLERRTTAAPHPGQPSSDPTHLRRTVPPYRARGYPGPTELAH